MATAPVGAGTSMTRQDALRTLAEYFRPQLELQSTKLNIDKFARKYFYIPETKQPMEMMPHQKSIIEYALSFDRPYTDGGTVIYSTPKKSGKTACSALIARWIAETWGTSNEIYCLANDMEQARGRCYQKVIDSIELDPQYMKSRDGRGRGNGWKIIERQAYFEPTRSFIRAISSDFKGEAGSNPTATFWTELWAYSSVASRKLWNELTPVPTRAKGLRYVETYAGFTDSSDLLLDLYTLGMKGRRLTHDDLNWPFDDQPPVWVNEQARLFMYWDSGAVAHRMDWQQDPEYYSTQAMILTPEAYERLHNNVWVSSSSSFIPTEWWDRCRASPPLPPLTTGNKEPMVLGVDAAVSGDCFAIVGVSRNPEPGRWGDPAVRLYKVWKPVGGAALDFSVMDQYLRELCDTYNVVQIAYDAYQLHKLMTDLRNDGVAWCKPFSQASPREIADKQLYDLIRDRRLAHNTGEEFLEHIRAAAAKDVGERDKLRIIKKGSNQHIDLVVALSMACYECMRLLL